MAKVVLQIVDDTGEIQEEWLVAGGIDTEEATGIMSQLRSTVDLSQECSSSGFVTEFHYQDGDVGAYDDINVRALWAFFSHRHAPSHIVIRPDTEEGQTLSNRLFEAGNPARSRTSLLRHESKKSTEDDPLRSTSKQKSSIRPPRHLR